MSLSNLTDRTYSRFIQHFPLHCTAFLYLLHNIFSKHYITFPSLITQYFLHSLDSIYYTHYTVFPLFTTQNFLHSFHSISSTHYNPFPSLNTQHFFHSVQNICWMHECRMNSLIYLTILLLYILSFICKVK